MVAYQNITIAGITITITNPQSFQWAATNDVLEQLYSGGGGSAILYGGQIGDIITFEGWCNQTDVTNLMATRDKKRPVVLQADILAQYYTINTGKVFVFIEDIIFIESSGRTSAVSRYYQYRFRVRKVADLDNSKYNSSFNVITTPFTFNLTATPIVTVPQNATSITYQAGSSSTGTRTCRDATLTYYKNPEGSQLSYGMTESDFGKNDITLAYNASGDTNEYTMDNGLFKIRSRLTQGSSRGGIDLFYWNPTAAAFTASGTVSLTAYDTQWRDMSAVVPTIFQVITDDPEWGVWNVIWNPDTNLGTQISAIIEIWRGKPYVKITPTNIGTTIVNAIECKITGLSQPYHWRNNIMLQQSSFPSSTGQTSASGNNPLSYPHQSKCFWASGRWWVFYSDGTNLSAISTTDGVTWSGVQTIRSTGVVAGFSSSVFFDGTYGYYAFSNQTAVGTALFYRRFTPNSDGTVTFSATEQTAVALATNTTYVKPTIGALSDGTIMIGYGKWLNNATNTSQPAVTKCSTTDGTWTTDTTVAFPITLNATALTGGIAVAVVVPQTAAKAYILYSSATTIRGQTWSGTAFGTEEVVSANTPLQVYYMSTNAINDDIHLVYLVVTSNNINYVKRSSASGAWGTDTNIVAAATATSAPDLSIDSNTDLYVFYAGSATTIKYISYSQVSAVWGTATLFLTDANLQQNDSIIASFGTAPGTSISTFINGPFICYLSNAASPYLVKMNIFNDDAQYIAFNYAQNYVSSVNPLAANTIITGIITSDKINDRHYRALISGANFNQISQYYNLASTNTPSGIDTESFWVFARKYENADDNPAVIATDVLVKTDITRGITKVT